MTPSFQQCYDWSRLPQVAMETAALSSRDTLIRQISATKMTLHFFETWMTLLEMPWRIAPMGGDEVYFLRKHCRDAMLNCVSALDIYTVNYEGRFGDLDLNEETQRITTERVRRSSGAA